jgi:phage repressor protein C with HTH and peptisase S24 domain
MGAGAGKRLERAIEMRGYPTVADFARAVDEEPGTLRVQLSRDSIPKDKAEKYQRRLRVPLEWLLYNRGGDPFEGTKPPAPAHEQIRTTILDIEGESFASVPRWDIRLSAGHGAVVPGTPEVLRRMLFRLDWLRKVAHAPVESLFILEVEGESMEPTLRSGDVALIDVLQNRPTQRDGLYALQREETLQVKTVSAHPTKKWITIKSDNPRFETWSEINPDEVHIIGRVIWIGRQM